MAPGQGGFLKQNVKSTTAPKEIDTNISKTEVAENSIKR